MSQISIGMQIRQFSHTVRISISGLDSPHVCLMFASCLPQGSEPTVWFSLFRLFSNWTRTLELILNSRIDLELISNFQTFLQLCSSSFLHQTSLIWTPYCNTYVSLLFRYCFIVLQLLNFDMLLHIPLLYILIVLIPLYTLMYLNPGNFVICSLF